MCCLPSEFASCQLPLAGHAVQAVGVRQMTLLRALRRPGFKPCSICSRPMAEVPILYESLGHGQFEVYVKVGFEGV